MNPSLKAGLRRLLPRSIYPHRILAGPLRGHFIVTSWHDYPAAILGRTERLLVDWFEKNVKPGETWLDIGAHYGYTAIALSHLVGHGGRVFAFEPVLTTAGYLERTRFLNGYEHVRVLPLALGTPQDLEVHQLPTVRGMVDSYVQTGDWIETILVTRLDWLWSRICTGHPEIDGVKIDVQGMELQVLQGMGGLLLQHKPKLVIEFHRGVERQAVLQFLRDYGYRAPSQPIEPIQGEIEPLYLDDRSYAFHVEGA